MFAGFDFEKQMVALMPMLRAKYKLVYSKVDSRVALESAVSKVNDAAFREGASVALITMELDGAPVVLLVARDVAGAAAKALAGSAGVTA